MNVKSYKKVLKFSEVCGFVLGRNVYKLSFLSYRTNLKYVPKIKLISNATRNVTLRIRNLRQFCGLLFSEHLWRNCWAIPSSLFKPDGTRGVKILLGIFWVQLSFSQIFPKRDYSGCAWYLQESGWTPSKLNHDCFL